MSRAPRRTRMAVGVVLVLAILAVGCGRGGLGGSPKGYVRDDGPYWLLSGEASQTLAVDAAPGDYEVCLTLANWHRQITWAEFWAVEGDSRTLLAKAVTRQDWAGTALLSVSEGPLEVKVRSNELGYWTVTLVPVSEGSCPEV